jgi:chaperonin GroES
MAIKPINGNVLVKPVEAPDQTPGGIHLPDTAKEDRREGEVRAVADNAIEEIAVGDRVIYKDFSGTEIEENGEDYILLASDDILVKYIEADQIPE